MAARRLLVFARAPERGRVKSRLAAQIGEAAAFDAHCRLSEHALAVAVATAPTELWIAPAEPTHGEAAQALIERWVARYGCTLRVQPAQADLGTRMSHALQSALCSGASQAVLIGTDCPQYSVAYLSEAFAMLEHRDAVFGPALDGGYLLVGARRDIVAAFDAVDWGTERVMQQTRARLAASGLSHVELAPLFDVDTEADWLRWRQMAPC